MKGLGWTSLSVEQIVMTTPLLRPKFISVSFVKLTTGWPKNDASAKVGLFRSLQSFYKKKLYGFLQNSI